MKINILLVNENDEIIGREEKIKAHVNDGLLHRAFSIFVFNEEQLLIQKRNKEKYHSGGLWSNTCCSHPYKDNNMKQLVKERLYEEMGFKCDLNYEFKFQYEKDFYNNITEREIDYVYIGNCEYKPVVNPNPKEVEDWKWIEINHLKNDLKANPEKYTYWFNICLDKVTDIYHEKYKR